MAATQKLVFVTGDKELDAKLTAMTPALQRKFVRGALRRGSKRLTTEIKRIVRAEAYDTGAFHKSIRSKSLKRSRNRVGIAVMPDRDKLFANYAKKHDGKTPHPAKGETDPFYYVAALEFGTETMPAVKPLRTALYENKEVYQEYFKADLRQFIAEQKVTTTLPKAVKGSKL